MGASVSKKRLEDWSSEELADALVTEFSDAYSKYREALVKDAVNGGAVAVLLNDAEFNKFLDELGIERMVHRSRLLYEWKTWKSQQLPPPSPHSSRISTTFRSPAKQALRRLGVDELATPNEAIGQLAIHFNNISLRYRYTTQDETTIGQRIQRDNSDNQHSFDIAKYLLDGDLTIGKELFEPDPNSTSNGEDLVINEPFSRIIAMVSRTSLKVKSSGQRSNLIDQEGREQRVDLSLFNSEYEEWASLVTVIEGKLDLKTSNYNSALGQCMRRATAILAAQPWRQFVIIPFHCLEDIAFLQVHWSGNRDFGCPNPIQSGKTQCLRIGNDNEVVVGDGFRALCTMLENPALFGYLPCPVRILTDLIELGFRSASPICIRSSQKALFVVDLVGDEADSAVLKVFRNRSAADGELANVKQLSGVAGTIKLKREQVLTIRCEWDEEDEECCAIVLSPYCRALTPSLASKKLLGDYAQILLDSWNVGLCNNDISPDNLLMIERDGEKLGIVTDWEIATSPGTTINPHTGKLLFCPAAQAGKRRTSSLLGDLESLFYVAVSCADNGVKWIVKRNDRTESDMFERRKRHTGLGARKPERFERWNDYLVGVRQALVRAQASGAEEDVEKIVRAFRPSPAQSPNPKFIPHILHVVTSHKLVTCSPSVLSNHIIFLLGAGFAI